MLNLETLGEQSFEHRKIIGLAFDSKTERLFIGLTKRRFNRYSNGEIWELDKNFDKKTLIYQDTEGLGYLEGGVTGKNLFTLVSFLTRSTMLYLSKSIIIQETNNITTIYPKDIPNNREKSLSFSHVSFTPLLNSQNNLLIYYNLPFVFETRIRPLTDYIDINKLGYPPYRGVTAIVPLREWQSDVPDIPDLLIARRYRILEGYSNGKKIATYDYRTRMNKFIPARGYIRQIIPKMYNGDFYLLLVGEGMGGANSLTMIKNFEYYWTIGSLHGWPTCVADINNDQKDEIISRGATYEFPAFSVYTDIYERKPTLLARKRMPIRTELNGLLVFDFDNDRRNVILAANEEKLIALALQ